MPLYDPAAIGGSPSRFSFLSNLNSSAADDYRNTGSASIAALYTGIQLNLGATTASRSSVGLSYPTDPNFFNRNPQVSFTTQGFDLGTPSAEASTLWLVMGWVGNANNAPVMSGANWAGFKVVKAPGGTTTSVFATHCDGTNAEVATDITSLVPNLPNSGMLTAIMSSGTSIAYYCDGSLLTTHTTNLPSGTLNYSRSICVTLARTAGTYNGSATISNYSLSHDLH